MIFKEQTILEVFRVDDRRVREWLEEQYEFTKDCTINADGLFEDYLYFQTPDENNPNWQKWRDENGGFTEAQHAYEWFVKHDLITDLADTWLRYSW